MKRLLLIGLCALSAAIFLSLALWQVERRSWKLDLMARVEARIHAPAADLPPSGEWARLATRDGEYRPVRVAGRYDHGRTVFVDALTELGPGAWVLTPLRTRTGTVLVNRGFVPKDPATAYARPSGEVVVRGLLRLTEPGGRFLRPNNPDANRWFSRDVEAIAANRRLGPVAPFFIDAAAEREGVYPRGGLTVVQFRNMHLVYALTWFALALLPLGFLAVLFRARPG